MNDLPAALARWRRLFRSRAFGMHEPGDLENDTAVRVLQQIRDGKTFRSARGIVGFIGFQVITNLHRKRVVVFAEGDFRHNNDEHEHDDVLEATTDVEPADEASDSERIARVRDALARVDATTRRVIESYYWRGNLVRKDEKKKQALHRAREAVRAAMVAG